MPDASEIVLESRIGTSSLVQPRLKTVHPGSESSALSQKAERKAL